VNASAEDFRLAAAECSGGLTAAEMGCDDPRAIETRNLGVIGFGSRGGGLAYGKE